MVSTEKSGIRSCFDVSLWHACYLVSDECSIHNLFTISLVIMNDWGFFFLFFLGCCFLSPFVTSSDDQPWNSREEESQGYALLWSLLFCIVTDFLSDNHFL